MTVDFGLKAIHECSGAASIGRAFGPLSFSGTLSRDSGHHEVCPPPRLVGGAPLAIVYRARATDERWFIRQRLRELSFEV